MQITQEAFDKLVDKIVDLESRLSLAEKKINNLQLKHTRFKPPTLEEVEGYYPEQGEKFYNYYSSIDWMVGKKKMKNWKMAVANWKKKEEKPKPIMRIYNPNSDEPTHTLR